MMPNPFPLFRPAPNLTEFRNLTAIESTRHGGVSPAPFASLNVGYNTPDSEENVTENRLRLYTELGILPDQVATSHQVHGIDVLVAETPGRYSGYDALITNTPDVFVGVSVADCTPILVYDAHNQAVAAIHAGWRGTVGGVVTAALQAMSASFNTRPADCYAYVGTCIDETSFEVGAEVAAQFAPAFKRLDAYTETWFVNLKSANVHQLTNFGIPSSQIGISSFSTVLNNEDYYSHRLEKGQTGRMMALIGVKS